MFMNSTAVADAERKRLESIVAVRKRSPWVPNPPPVDHANPWPLSQRKACVIQIIHLLRNTTLHLTGIVQRIHKREDTMYSFCLKIKS